MARMIGDFAFEHDGRKYTCTVEAQKSTPNDKRWWFAVTGDQQRYAPIEAVPGDALAPAGTFLSGGAGVAAAIASLDPEKVLSLVRRLPEGTLAGAYAPAGAPEEALDRYVASLAEGIGQIAAAFAPNPVIVRLSDFKSNEYKKLLGGERYEPDLLPVRRDQC